MEYTIDMKTLSIRFSSREDLLRASIHLIESSMLKETTEYVEPSVTDYEQYSVVSNASTSSSEAKSNNWDENTECLTTFLTLVSRGKHTINELVEIWNDGCDTFITARKLALILNKHVIGDVEDDGGCFKFKKVFKSRSRNQRYYVFE